MPRRPHIDFPDGLYPATGKLKVAAAGKVADELRAAMEKRLQIDPYNLTAKDATAIGLENLSAAQTLVDRAKQHANHDELEVVGGLLQNGDLALAVVGSGAASAPVVLRANFETKVIGRLAKPKNAVANIQPGHRTIDAAAEAQAKKFGLENAQKSRDDIDVGGIKVGTVVLAAHGTPEKFEGTVIGTHLGKKTPEQIVALLTENADEKKRLSPKFRGTLLLSGCFTAAGDVPPNYDYKVFAKQVYQLLLKKDYREFEVQGMPGPSKTVGQGNKTVQPVKDYLKQKDIEKEQKAAEENAKTAASLLKQAEAKEQALQSERQKAQEQVQKKKTQLQEWKAMAQEAKANGLENTLDIPRLESQVASLEADIASKDKGLQTVQRIKANAKKSGAHWDKETVKQLDKWLKLEDNMKPMVETYGKREV